MAAAFQMRGLPQLNRLVKAASSAAKRDLNNVMREVAEPIRADAQALAVASIPRVGLAWSQMRVGVTQKLVYVAPRQRGVRGGSSKKRPNFATLMDQRAMRPARDRNEAQVERRVERAFELFAARWNGS